MHNTFVKRLLGSSDGRTFEISIGVPRDTGKGDFACSYEIKSMSLNLKLESVGLNSLQALLLSLKSIGSQLNLIQEEEGVQIYWINEQLDHGFPSI
jgi:hypothetical protein